ncbi:MAG TPA: DNA polymerase/3'-5' exonuclease PolX [Planctomycetaceae bacterium]|nr:DNA polymerase/3'-5' exonuclease PolX [Planctomycetaceae bacterium]
MAAALEQLADLLEFQGANAFRIRAYRNSSRVIRDYPESIADIVASDPKSLTAIDGIGKGVADKCTTLVQTGELPQIQEILQQIPPTVLDLLRVPGLGPKKAALIHRELGIENLQQLELACQQEQVRGLKGLGPKSEQQILQGIAIADAANQRIYWCDADRLAAELRTHFADCKSIQQFDFAGSYRRGKETVGDLDLLVVSENPEPAMDHLARFSRVQETIARGETKMSVRLVTGFQIDLRVVANKSFGAALQYFTGSQAHNVQLRSLAKQRGLKINEYGLFRTTEEGETYVAGETEEELYRALDLPAFAPELREARREFEWAANNSLPDLITAADIRGDLHMHTTASDGKHSLAEMAQAARQRGLQYIAITDHSQRVTMANGLNAKRLLEQWKKIDQFNRTLKDGFLVLKGIECDILEKGGLDLPDQVLAKADWVIAAIHYGQKQPRQQITDRLLEAIANPYVCTVAHPTGRLINRREPYAVDLEAVFQAAADQKKTLELNANPARLDLDDVQCAAAKSYGIPLVINTDAHQVEGLDVMQYGILQARRAGLTRNDVANTGDWKDLRAQIGTAGP